MSARVLPLIWVFVAACASAPPPSAQHSDDLLPDSPPPPPAGSEAVKRGENLLSQGKAAEAKAAFEEAIAGDPQDARAHFDLGIALEMLSQPDDAQQAYRKALELKPDFSEAENNLALLLRDQGDLDAALALLREAADKNPSSASTQANLALALEDSGDVAGAQSAYEAALKIAPDDLMTKINYGLLRIRRGDAEAGGKMLLSAQQAAAGNRAALSAIGPGLRMASQPQPAVQALQDAIAAGDGQPTPALLSELGLAQRAAGDREGAITSLKQALKLDSSYATAHYLLGNMYAGDKDFGEAERHYQAYLKLAPNGPQADRAKERLQMARKLKKKR